MTYSRITLFVALCLASLAIAAAEPPQKSQDQVLSLTWENDSFSNSGDRGYTQGIKLSYLGKDLPAGPLADRLSRILAFGAKLQVQKLGLALGQNIYTPSDLSRTDAIAGDRPYAGWLYGGPIYQRLGTNRLGPVLESFEVDVGVIGPSSLADQTQTTIHHWLGAPKPGGWRHQLKDEPGIILNYGRSQLYRLFDWRNFRFDVVPSGGVRLGSVTAGALGTVFRLGYNIPSDFGHFPIGNSLVTPFWGLGARGEPQERPGSFGFYFFSGAEGRAVLYNTFLDGNIFRESHHVDRKPFVADLKAGAAFIFKRVEISYAYVYRTEEFSGQLEPQTFGSVNVKFFF